MFLSFWHAVDIRLLKLAALMEMYFSLSNL